MAKQSGCLARLVSLVIVIAVAIWGINACSEHSRQARKAEEERQAAAVKIEQDRRAALTPEQRAAEDRRITEQREAEERKAAEEKAKAELESRMSMRQSQTENRSIEYMLATINAGTYVPEDDITVTRFRYLLQTLNDKTINTKQQIADMSVAAVTALRDKYGKDVKLLAFMEGMNAMLPAGERADYAVRSALYMQELKR